jgi:hypothetical protein
MKKQIITTIKNMQPQSIDLGRGNYMPAATQCLPKTNRPIANLTKKQAAAACNFYKTT